MPEPGEQTPDSVSTPLYGAAITHTAPWHNAPGTDTHEIPEPVEYRVYDTGDDGTPVAKVLAPPKTVRVRETRLARASSTAVTAKTADTDDESAGDG